MTTINTKTNSCLHIKSRIIILLTNLYKVKLSFWMKATEWYW